MKKKMLAIVMAVAMTASLSSLAFAADVTKPDGSTSSTGDVSVTYEVSPSYTISIPAAVNYTGQKATLDPVKASDVLIEGKQQIDVKISQTGITGTNLQLKNASEDILNVPLLKDDAAYTLGDVFISFKANDATGKSLVLDAVSADHAGSFSGTLTFSIDITTTPTT